MLLRPHIVVRLFLGTQMQGVLVQFQQHPQAWARVASIMVNPVPFCSQTITRTHRNVVRMQEHSTNPHAKVIALTVLYECIKYRWNTLPNDQRTGIQTFVVATHSSRTT